jgi:hypothetical protein
MSVGGFTLIPFPEAVKELDLESHFAGRMFRQYFESADDAIARIVATPDLLTEMEKLNPNWRETVRRRYPMRHVRHYAGHGTVAGDIDLDKLCYEEKLAGIVSDGDLTIEGTIFNWEIDTKAIFLAVRGSLTCRNVVAGCADIVVRGDAHVGNTVVATYNHGRLEIGGDAYAKCFIVDDHHTYVGRDVHGYGWQCAGHGDVEVPESDWIDEVRPEFKSEFFKDDGDMKCPDGNVDLVKALLAGRAILRQ